MSDFHAAQHDFRVALCDSFNTPSALTVLLDIVSKVNVYIATRSSSANMEPVQVIAEWVTRMLRMFGLGEGATTEGQLGWGKEVTEGEGSGGEEFEKKVDKYLKALVGFRDEIRRIAIGGGDGKEILALCDKFRDSDLVELGVQLDDGQGAGKSFPSQPSP
jgi:cysteinyl-tRNA synthetase